MVIVAGDMVVPLQSLYFTSVTTIESLPMVFQVISPPMICVAETLKATEVKTRSNNICLKTIRNSL